jgi:hypothetical protein
MNCTIVQRRLLSIANPERVPVNLRTHLAYCGACREWHNQLILVERHVPLLPVPRSNGKTKLMRRVLQDGATTDNESGAPAQSPALSTSTRSDARSPTLLATRTLVLGAAAALLLIMLGCSNDPLR